MMKQEMKYRKIDLIIIIVWPVVASLLAFIFNANALASVVLFYALPALFLSVRYSSHIRKSLLFALGGAIPLGIVIDAIAHASSAWAMHSMVAWRLFDFATLEGIVWAFFLFYFTVIFYECFISHHHDTRTDPPHLKYFLIVCLTIFSVFVLTLLANPSLLNIPYFYAWLGLLGITLPIVIELIGFRRIFSRFFSTAAYFFYLNFLYEIVALKLGWWDFPGREFLGWISIFGVRFPFEEFFFWICLFTFAILTYYEFYDEPWS